MNRRSFLSFLSAAVAGATWDIERLLWRPRKMISVPKLAPLPISGVAIQRSLIDTLTVREYQFALNRLNSLWVENFYHDTFNRVHGLQSRRK